MECLYDIDRYFVNKEYSECRKKNTLFAISSHEELINSIIDKRYHPILIDNYLKAKECYLRKYIRGKKNDLNDWFAEASEYRAYVFELNQTMFKDEIKDMLMGCFCPF